MIGDNKKHKLKEASLAFIHEDIQEKLNTRRKIPLKDVYFPQHVIAFMDNLIQRNQTDLNSLNNINIIILDKDYIQWCENKKINCKKEKSKRLYLNSLSKDDINNLWSKYEYLTKSYDEFIIFMLLGYKEKTKKSEFYLSEDLHKNILNQLTKTYSITQNDIWLSQQFIDIDDYLENSNIFKNVAKIYFDNNKKVFYSKYNTQECKTEINIAILTIPIVVKKERKYPIFKIKDIITNNKYNPLFINNLPDQNNSIYLDLDKYINNNDNIAYCKILPQLVAKEDVKKLYFNLIKSLTNEKNVIFVEK